jgi:hypothetical protein
MTDQPRRRFFQQENQLQIEVRCRSEYLYNVTYKKQFSVSNKKAGPNDPAQYALVW